MNINYINESVISAAVMRRNHTRIHTCGEPAGRGQHREDICCVSRASLSSSLQNRRTVGGCCTSF